MNLSFRSKLLALVATAALALVALVVSSALVARRVERHLDDIRQHYLPKVGLRPRLEAQFERIQRGFQDAVAASDSEKLAGTAELKKEFLRQLADSSEAVEPALAAALAQAVEEFHAKGLAVSARLIARETGEGVVAQIGELQGKPSGPAPTCAWVSASPAWWWCSSCRSGSAAKCWRAWPTSRPGSAASARATSAPPSRW